MTWVGSYQETCRELGIEEAELEFPGGPGRGIAALVDCYTTRVHGLLNTWFTNILEVRFAMLFRPSSAVGLLPLCS